MARLSNQHCKNHYTSYELFGFDIILDGNFKPWILEVNITPSLKSDSDLDTRVKYGVIRDMFNIAGYNLPPVTYEEFSTIEDLIGCRLFFDQRLYKDNLTKCDKVKHLKYQRLAKVTPGPLRSASSAARDQDPKERNDEEKVTDKVSNCGDHSDVCRDDEPICNNGRRCGLNEEEDTGSDELMTDSILSDLTQNDIRILMLSEDELSRCGQFKRVFPSPTSSKYLKYFDRARYYNLLLDAWEQKYHTNRMEGISRLSSSATFLD